MGKDADPLNYPSMKLAFEFISGGMSKLAYGLLAVSAITKVYAH